MLSVVMVTVARCHQEPALDIDLPSKKAGLLAGPELLPWAELVGFSHSFMHTFIQSTSVSRLLCMGTVASL